MLERTCHAVKRVVAPHRGRRLSAPRHAWIPLADGCRLSARLWLPEGTPAPAVLEYIPYRKDDITAPGDERRMAWFAQHGYACLRVDLRGTGDSDGVLIDEYLIQEQDDAIEVISWIAEQDWCDGAVGMIGISWGGFNALQVAARRPAALRAVISCMSTDDRYSDDVHYVGGSLLADTQHSWATSMLVYATLPPDPAVLGEGWREIWLERLEAARPMIEPWMEHQRRTAYWRHGSVCEDYGAIQCPVMAVGGWSDGYRDAVLRMLERLSVPRRGLIGPWSHAYPHEAVAPGPAMGFLQECLRWWDEWLRGEPAGVQDEPLLLAWMQEPAQPATFYPERPGRWVSESEWPPRRAAWSLALGGEGVLGSDAPGRPTVCSPMHAGMEGGFWCPFGNVGDWAPDQRGEEALSLCFTTAPLERRLELLGRPRLQVRLESDRPLAQLAVRLNAVSQDGSSALLTTGMLNLAHRASHEQPEPLEPGRPYDVTIELQSLGQAVAAGQRLRLAIATGSWPWLWPSPERTAVTIHAGPESVLELPVRNPSAVDGHTPALDPESAPELAHTQLRSRSGERTVEHLGAMRRLTHIPHDFDLQIDGGARVDWSGPDVYTIADGDPLSASIESVRQVRISRNGWEAEVHVESSMRSDAEAFEIETRLVARTAGETVCNRGWDFRIPRDLV
ncbi:MAG TPA: CocE/NonD family hydrolase [Gaiellales bacterium]